MRMFIDLDVEASQFLICVWKGFYNYGAEPKNDPDTIGTVLDVYIFLNSDIVTSIHKDLILDLLCV